MDNEQLQELLIECVRDLYDAEKQLVKALPKMAKAADSEDLANGIEEHLEQTKGQVERLEKVFELLETPARGKTCKAMKGLIEEGSEALEEEEAGPRRDLLMIAAAQKVEHYEISGYGTARSMAEHLELEEVAALLQETEEEESAADENLTKVAMMLYGAVVEDEEAGEMPKKGPAQAEQMGRPAARKKAASR
jgi:ferritin-like metal-binding protein YciE